MKRVGVRELRDHATGYFAGDEPVAIEQHGEPIGFYIPTGTGNRQSFSRALHPLEEAVQRVLAESGLSEEALSKLYDLNEALPAENGAQRGDARPGAHAARR